VKSDGASSSVKNIAQVTKAMEAVSAAKMRKAQQQVLATRAYATQAREVLAYIARLSSTEHELNPLIRPRPVKRVGMSAGDGRPRVGRRFQRQRDSPLRQLDA
jgi:hypothetical protein